MKVSVELTLSPLQNDYEIHIINFIKRLRSSKFRVLEIPLSTQIYGDFDELMSFLNEEIKRSFAAVDVSLLQMKIVKTDRSDYEPNF